MEHLKIMVCALIFKTWGMVLLWFYAKMPHQYSWVGYHPSLGLIQYQRHQVNLPDPGAQFNG